MKGLVLFLFFLNIFSFAQKGTFEKIIGSGNAADVKECSDGSFVLAVKDGELIKIIKTDPAGNILWSKSNLLYYLNSIQIEITNTNEVLVTGYVKENNDDIGLIKLDGDGNILWEKTFGTTEHGEYGSSVATVSDGNIFLVAGQVPSYLSHISKEIIYKLDSNGNILWQKDLPQSNLITPRYNNTQILPLTDGNVAVLLNKQLLKINLLGIQLWSNYFSFTAYGICEADGNNIFLSSTTSLKKYSSNGTQLFALPVSGSYMGGIYRSQKPGYYIYKSQYGTIRFIGTNGDSLYQKKFNGEISKVIETNDRNYLFVGSFLSRSWICRTDSNFNYQSLRFYTFLKETKYKYGDVISIGWYRSGTSGKISINLSTDNGSSWRNLASSIVDSGFYNWQAEEIISTECKFRIFDPENPVLEAETEVFTIYPNTNQDYISVNNILMWIKNDGYSSHDPRTDGSGLMWKTVNNIPVVFADGLIWGGKVNGEIRVNGSKYRTGLKPGNMKSLNVYGDSDDPSFSILKIPKNWEQTTGIDHQRYKFNYENWPGKLGAPFEDVDHDGKYSPQFDLPKIIGDEMLWFVANDGDTIQSQFLYGSLPIGIEMQCTVFAFNAPDYLKDVVFKKYLLINKSANDVEEMRLSYWSDPDLGDASDDFIGFDTTLQMAYCYNSDDNDQYYFGSAPPALGYVYLENPYIPATESDSGFVNGVWKMGIKNTKIGANVPGTKNFGLGPEPPQGVYEGTLKSWNFLNGIWPGGEPMIEPYTNQPVKIALAGDPVSKTGWYEGEGWPNGYGAADRRLYSATEPFTLAAGDTQEIIIAVMLARGIDNINSISELRTLAQNVKKFYYNELPSELNKTTYKPKEFSLYQNYPNPFNPVTRIKFRLPLINDENKYVNVTLKVFDILGNIVAVLINQELNSGYHEITFNSSTISSGIYFYQILAGEFMDTKKMMVLK